MTPASQALEELRAGNRRFVARIAAGYRVQVADRPLDTAAGQNPFAVVLGCSDSRVPVELVFDQGLGDLFVIRVAGNIVAPSQVGSVEFAAQSFGTRLVVVLGHSNCGAVLTTLDELEQPSEQRSPNLAAIVNRVRPAVQSLLDLDPPLERETLVRQAVRANIRASVNGLRHGSDIIEGLIADDGLLVVGAEYCLESGEVEFLDEA